MVGSCYRFATTAVKAAAKGVVLDRLPPVVKYPALCTALAGCCIASIATGGNPLTVSATVTIGEAIVECAID